MRLSGLAARAFFTFLALAAPSRAALDPAGFPHEVMGDDPLLRQSQRAPLGTVMWVKDQRGAQVPIVALHDPGMATLPVGSLPSTASDDPLRPLQPHAALRPKAAQARKAAPKAAVRQARHIDDKKIW